MSRDFETIFFYYIYFPILIAKDFQTLLEVSKVVKLHLAFLLHLDFETIFFYYIYFPILIAKDFQTLLEVSKVVKLHLAFLLHLAVIDIYQSQET